MKGAMRRGSEGRERKKREREIILSCFESTVVKSFTTLIPQANSELSA